MGDTESQKRPQNRAQQAEDSGFGEKEPRHMTRGEPDSVQSPDFRKALVHAPQHGVEGDQCGDQQRYPDSLPAAEDTNSDGVDAKGAVVEPGEEVELGSQRHFVDFLAGGFRVFEEDSDRGDAGPLPPAGNRGVGKEEDLPAGQMDKGRLQAVAVDSHPLFVRLVDLDVDGSQRVAGDVAQLVEAFGVDNAHDRVVGAEDADGGGTKIAGLHPEEIRLVRRQRTCQLTWNHPAPCKQGVVYRIDEVFEGGDTCHRQDTAVAGSAAYLHRFQIPPARYNSTAGKTQGEMVDYGRLHGGKLGHAHQKCREAGAVPGVVGDRGAVEAVTGAYRCERGQGAGQQHECRGRKCRPPGASSHLRNTQCEGSPENASPRGTGLMESGSGLRCQQLGVESRYSQADHRQAQGQDGESEQDQRGVERQLEGGVGKSQHCEGGCENGERAPDLTANFPARQQKAFDQDGKGNQQKQDEKDSLYGSCGKTLRGSVCLRGERPGSPAASRAGSIAAFLAGGHRFFQNRFRSVVQVGKKRAADAVRFQLLQPVAVESMGVAGEEQGGPGQARTAR